MKYQLPFYRNHIGLYGLVIFSLGACAHKNNESGTSVLITFYTPVPSPDQTPGELNVPGITITNSSPDCTTVLGSADDSIYIDNFVQQCSAYIFDRTAGQVAHTVERYSLFCDNTFSSSTSITSPQSAATSPSPCNTSHVYELTVECQLGDHTSSVKTSPNLVCNP